MTECIHWLTYSTEYFGNGVPNYHNIAHHCWRERRERNRVQGRGQVEGEGRGVEVKWSKGRGEEGEGERRGGSEVE